MCSIFSFSSTAGAERAGTLCLCERGEWRPVCVPGCVCAGVHRDTFSAMETSTGSDCLGHTHHHGLHIHLLQPHHPALGPGNLGDTVTFSEYQFLNMNRSKVTELMITSDRVTSVPPGALLPLHHLHCVHHAAIPAVVCCGAERSLLPLPHYCPDSVSHH